MRRLLLLLTVPLLMAPPSPAAAEDYSGVSSGYRFAGLPDFLVSPTFADHQPVLAHGFSAHYAMGEWDSHWTAGLAGGSMLTPPGYWRAAGARPRTAVHVEYPIGFFGAYVGHAWRIHLWKGLHFSPAVAVGMAALLGDAYATEVLPGCEGEVTQCGHWRNVTRHPVEFAYRLLPIVIASASLAYRITDHVVVALDTGLWNLPFVGLSAEWVIEGSR